MLVRYSTRWELTYVLVKEMRTSFVSQTTILSLHYYNCRVIVPTMATLALVFQLTPHPADPPKVTCAQAKSVPQICAFADRTVPHDDYFYVQYPIVPMKVSVVVIFVCLCSAVSLLWCRVPYLNQPHITDVVVHAQ